MMWTIKSLFEHCNTTQAEINGKWYPARPLNGTKKYTSFSLRLKRAWEVFQGRADVFKWPAGQ